MVMTCNEMSRSRFMDALTAAILESRDLDHEWASHLQSCEPCSQWWSQMLGSFDALGSIVPRLTPPSRLKARIMAIASQQSGDGGQIWKNWKSAEEQLQVVRANPDDWMDTSYIGIQVRRLFADRLRDRITMLVRMAPGSAYPPHIHGGMEECFVLSGELKIGELTLKTGDYQHAPSGSAHVTQSTETGCLLLISSSYHDELFVGAS
ncbi:MAG: cupin domain-containing protein [Acidobacteria bacterium]|nr:cupin domain-containing protein [Acidobacteriota bacterium]